MIKPEDITQDHVAKLENYIRGRYDWSQMSDSAEIALMANALIVAGIVSPPVWVICNNTTGELAKHPLCDLLNLLVDKTVATVEGWQCELWKGQAE